MRQATPIPSEKKCNQCGSILFMVKKVTEQVDNYSPVTVTIYSCSNQECQDDIDKKTLARIKENTEQKKAKDERLKLKIKNMKVKKKKL